MPTPRSKLAEQVFEQMRSDILSGRFASEERLPPQDVLAREYNVSRTVIREAQSKLASLGLVRIDQGRGTFVTKPDPSQILKPMLYSLHIDETSTRELIECRYHLELVIVRLAARRCTQTDAAHLEQLWEAAMEAAKRGDIDSFSREDFAFHHYLAVVSRNRIFARIVDTIRDLNLQFLKDFSRTEGAVERALAYHRRILDAVAARDVEGAEREMLEHLNDIVAAVRRHYRFDLEIRA
ncbi:DNA-binding transcriptional regulator, FadR family [Desulfacinum infernum DSM 9756]|uniref:DNA-binding transcriptional regulator, FadR family n=1 Tax=Desulfacinum infernum DSM 9756 TaxID=1121391 RepID=A0A1M5BRA1_9BACT|nr:FadR/GntR family transcriptional regulator [Desulfacinum infernum]SHF44946.1 DNA-binding transcriptional regulator, FadR family [Desulfacinum infernum DSM 9756]